MRIITAALVFGISVQASAQSEVKYRTVDIPEKGRDATGIEFTIPLDDRLAPQRIREAAERRKMDLGSETQGMTLLGKTVPGLCESSRGPFLRPGTPAPTGPCQLTLFVSYRPDTSGTTFVVSGTWYMKIHGGETNTGGDIDSRSTNWTIIRTLARAIAERK